ISTSKLCVSYTIWKVGDYDASLGTMLLETGGTIGQADSSWFKIVQSSQFGYNLLYCPVTSTMSCPFSLDDQFCLKVGVVHQNGKRRLALVNGNPLECLFKQVQ
nr:RecName: Full=Serine protease inhibitor 4; Short=PI-4 [Solanum tuberosum]